MIRQLPTYNPPIPFHQEAQASHAAADRELEQRILEGLQSRHVPSLRNVQVEVREGAVTLRGAVTSFYARQLSHNTARRWADGAPVVDQIDVVSPAAFRDPLQLAKTAAAGVALTLLLLISGCSESQADRLPVHPVTGQVSLNGKPASGAMVIFHPLDEGPNFPAPRAQADSEGNFVLTTYRAADGAPLGEYVVTVEWHSMVKNGDEFESGPNLVPPQFSNPDTTSLVARVNEGDYSVPIRITR